MERNELRKRVVGSMTIGDSVDITDPCYNRDVWCRINDVSVTPGNYTCVIWRQAESYNWNGEKREFESVIRCIGIYLDGVIPDQDKMFCIGEIGVDAGLAGFFPEKPDFSDDEWAELCQLITNADYHLNPDLGFFSESGEGDGTYEVYAGHDEAMHITGLEIRFTLDFDAEA